VRFVPAIGGGSWAVLSDPPQTFCKTGGRTLRNGEPVDSVQEILDTERQLGPLAWLVAGDHGWNRTRGYVTTWSVPGDRALGELRRLITKNKLAAGVASSTGIGRERVVGEVAGERFTASFYSPTEQATITPLSRVRVVGQVNDKPSDECDLLLWIRPGMGGLITLLVGVVLGLGTIAFGLGMFATKTEWESFGIALGIGLALMLIPFCLLLWSVVEGRANEGDLLNRLALCMQSDVAKGGLDPKP
jgi:hypothetical protein